jgi:formamidopyrimidine-DNA glycosylase
MPELPDITVYCESIADRVRGRVLEDVRFASPFFLRSFDPPIAAAKGRRVDGVERLGKRIVLVLDGNLFLVLHLMIAGRLRWLDRKAKIPGKIGLAALDFETGTLAITEASTKKRASLHLVAGREGLQPFSRGGLEVLEADLAAFREVLGRESHTLKRSLTDPRLFSGIGNAYSDEVLHRAQLSPVKLSRTLTDEETKRLYEATREVLVEWTERLRAEVAASKSKWPENVTAFREGMAVHGRYKQPCPRCGGPVQRIRYAENETNYCPACQTGGKLLADRALSRLLHGDWPRTLEEMEEYKAERTIVPSPSPPPPKSRSSSARKPRSDGRGGGIKSRRDG